MGTFVLGVLVGWLAEWLFFTFWVKGGSNSDSSECEELRVALDAKNKEITALKAGVAKKTDSKATSSTAASTIKSAVQKTASTKKATSTNKTGSKKAPPKKSTAKKPVTKKAVTANKSTPAKKATSTKKTTAVKKPTAKKKLGDDLTKLSGIGPSMAATMGELGIITYKKLAAMDDDILRDMLEASGARLNNNKEAMDSWNEQATLADKGDFVGLKKLQEEIKG